MLGLFRSPPRHALLEDLKRAYGLEYVEADASVVGHSGAPNWWRGHASAVRFGIRPLGKLWEVYLGQIPPIVDLELTRAGVRGARPVEEIRLERFLPERHALLDGWVASFVAHDDERFHGPQLAGSNVASSIVDLHPAVQVVRLYRRGVELRVAADDWDRSAFDGDVSRATRIVKGLEGFAAQHPPRLA